MKVIESDNIMKSFRKVRALSGTSFAVNKGSVMGLIGPNGAGKTTIIKILTGLLRPDSGEARILGESPWNNPRVSRRVGQIHEKPKFPLNITLIDYLSLVAKMYGCPDDQALRVLRDVKLDDAHQRQIGKLSAGMLQRFALAHALIHDPEIIIADEPTSNLDQQARANMLNAVIEANRDKGTTFLISSHLLSELSGVCDTVSVIDSGKVVASGNLDELYENFRAQVTRISTDKPVELSERIKKLAYVIRAQVAGDNIVVEMESNQGHILYRDVLDLADGVGATINGIESKGASLEELFRRIISAQSGKL